MNSSGKQAFVAFKSAILHACAKQKMTNDSTVSAIQLVVAREGEGKENLMNGKLLTVLYLSGMPFR